MKKVLFSFGITAIVVIFLLSVAVTTAEAAPLTPSEQAEVASLLSALENMRKILEVLKLSLIPQYAYAESTTAPNAPTNLAVSIAENGDATFSWIDNSSLETIFEFNSAQVSFYSLANTTSRTLSYASQPDGTTSYTIKACVSWNTENNAHWYYCSTPSNAASVTKSPVTGSSPTVPTGFSATIAANNTDVNLSWVDVSDETEYKISRRVSSGSWSTLSSVGANIISYADLAVPAGTYDYHINACNSYGCSTDSSVATVVISAADVTPPSLPSSLTASAFSSTRVDISWGASTDNIGVTAYKVFRDGNFITSTTAFSYSDNTVLAGVTYSYYVKAIDAAGNESLPSAAVSATTPSAATATTTVPSSPIDLTATFRSGYGDIELKWTDNSYEDEFKVYRRITGGSWSFLGTRPYAAGGIVYYYDTTIAAGTSYDYHVNACISSTCSADSNIAYVSIPATAVTATTTAPVGDITVPVFSNVRTENVMGTGAQIKWNTDDLSDSRVSYGTSAGFHTNVSEFRCDAGGNVTDHCVNLSGLVFSTSYYYKAVSKNSSGYEGNSVEFNFLSAASSTLGTTTAYTIPVPPSLSIASSNFLVSLNWFDVSDEDRYDIYRRLSGSTTGWEYRGKRNKNEISFSESGLPAGTYEYQIFACNVYGCSGGSNIAIASVVGASTATTTVAADTVSPYVSQFGHFIELDGRLRTGVMFSESIDSASLTELNVYIISVVDGSKIAGVVNKYPSGVDYFTSAPASTTLEYQLVVKKDVKDLAGNKLVQDYISERIKPGVHITPIAPPIIGIGTKPFMADTFGTFPRNTETRVSPLIRIHVQLTKEIDLASTVAQFFILASLSSPDKPVGGTFQFFGDSFDFVPSAPLEQNKTYIYKVLTTLKDKSGASLSYPYSATFTTSSESTTVGSVIEGVVKDSQGGVVANASVLIYRDDFGVKFAATSGSDGLFRMSVPVGTYFIEAYPPFERRELVRPAPVKVNISSGEKSVILLQFVGVTKQVTGVVKFSDGTAVTDAEVGAYSYETHQWTGIRVDSFGVYTLRLGGGRWTVGIRPKDYSLTAKWSYSGPFREVSFAKDFNPETQIIDFAVPIFDSTARVTIVDDQDKAISEAGVIIDTVKAGTAFVEGGAATLQQFRLSDSTGVAKFNVSSGRYYIRAYLPSGKGYINPSEQEVTVGQGRTLDIKIVFRRIVATPTIELKGTVKLNDGTLTDAFVWGWSEKGGFISTFSSTNGTFEHKVMPSDRWHIGAGKEVGGIPYRSSDIIVDIGETLTSVEIILVQLSRHELPAPVVVKESAAGQIVAQVEDGARAIIPPRAVATTGNVSVEMKPTIEAPSQAAAQVVSTVYDVSIRDTVGKSVTSLKEEIEIIIPYNETELAKEGVSEDAVVPSFFDEKTGTWVKVDNFTIDKDKNIVVIRVKHLTRFALVAAADITPPLPPKDISATPLGQGRVQVVWMNPTRDFDHAKVYRNEKKGELGKLVGAEIAAGTFIDEEVLDGVTYYYTVRAVDPAGNESGNKDQISVQAKGTFAASKIAIGVDKKEVAKTTSPGPSFTTALFARNLSVGSSGDDVKNLQTFLKDAGLYPEGIVSGFFGHLTRQAVIRLQEKYADKILKPIGLSQGTGFVGSATRKIINELLAK